MTAQLIFFSAVALFIIILLRRTSWLEAAWHFAVIAGKTLGAGMLTIMNSVNGQLANRAKKISLPKVSLPNRERSTGGGGGFWREELIEDKPEIMTHYDEGETLFKAGKLDEAERFFLTAATRNPKDSKVYARLGLIYLQKKNYTDAIDALKVAVKLDRFNPSRYYNLALAYEGNKDNQRAIATIREAISLDPVSPKYRTLLEQLLNKK